MNTFIETENHHPNDLYNFLLKYSEPPTTSESLPFLKAALLLLLLHPFITKDSQMMMIKVNKPDRKVQPLRSLLLQILGRCVRRSNRAQLKTLPITVPLLLPHFKDSNVMKLIVDHVHSDLNDRFLKIPDIKLLYTDPLTANLLIVFDFLYLLNESFMAISYTGQISQTNFYHKFNSFNVCEDYAHWRELTEDSKRHVPFAFCDFPWIFDLDTKRTLLIASNSLKQRHHLQDAFFRAIFDGIQSPHLQINIRRDHLLQDALEQLLSLPPHQLAKQLRISFVGEEGVDEGGLKKEFFHLCWSEIFRNISSSPFKQIEENGMFWFNDEEIKINGDQTETITSTAKFVGILLALAIYNGVLVAPNFPLLLFKKLLNWPLQLEDYSEIDPILINSINVLLELDEFEILKLDLYHVVPGSDLYELTPGGSNIPVTHANLNSYIAMLTGHLLHQYSLLFSAFRSGFELISAGSVIYGYRPDEIYSLAYGSNQFDLNELKSIAIYDGGYFEKSPQIIWFWSILFENFSNDQQSEFLAFVTGSARAPIGGLSKLKSFTVTCIPGDSERLPTAHTCFNTLLLPQYSQKEKLLHKLQLAILHNKGFGLI